MSSIRIALTCILVGSVILCSPSRTYPDIWREFITHEGQDLHALDGMNRQRFGHLLETLLPAEDGLRYGPYCLGRFDRPGDSSRFVLVMGQPLFIIPGESRVRIHIFDMKGRHLSSTAFSTGWRINLKGARIIANAGSGSSQIEISTQLVIGGRDISRQVYGLIGNEVVLLSLQDSTGRMLRHAYDGHQIGP